VFFEKGMSLHVRQGGLWKIGAMKGVFSEGEGKLLLIRWYSGGEGDAGEGKTLYHPMKGRGGTLGKNLQAGGKEAKRKGF